MTPHTPPPEESAESNVLDASDSVSESARPDRWARLRQLAPIITSATSAVVLILAFLLPGAQDQWDRWQSRKVIDAYAEVGRQLMTEQRYVEAEQAFAKAFELSENRRLDLEQERLVAHIHRLLLEPSWGAPNPVDITESDFRSLIVLQARDGDTPGQARTQALLADFLASEGRVREAVAAAQSAVAKDSTFARGWVSLGNALEEMQQSHQAEIAYRRALALDSTNASAAYDLALLLDGTGENPESHALFRRAAALAPDDTLVLGALITKLRKSGDTVSIAAAQLRRSEIRAIAVRRRASRDTTSYER